MQNRFIVEEVILESDHPQWPGQLMYRIKNTEKNEYRMEMYTTAKSANKACKSLNIRYKL